MNLRTALLEDWMRQYYYSAEIDLGSSGVEGYALGEIRQILGLKIDCLDEIVLNDGHSLGGLPLRLAIADRYKVRDPDWVMVTHGSNEGLFLIMNALLSKGDEVVVIDPAYQQLFGTAEAIGAKIRRWILRFEDRFEPDCDALRHVVSAKTKMVVVNFPHNPTGASLDAPSSKELVKLTASVGAWLVWDAAFADLSYGSPPPPLLESDYDRVIRLGTMSKAYGLPGLRVGWCIGSPEVLNRSIQIRDFITLHLSPLIERIAEAAIIGADHLIEPRLKQALKNLSILSQWVEEHHEWIEWASPQGGVCAFPRLRSTLSTDSLCKRLGQNGVLLVPGSCFRKPDFIRMGFGGPTSKFRQGLLRLSNVLRNQQHLIDECASIAE